MSADNYYLIRRHPAGGFVAIMGFMSDEEVPEVNPQRDTDRFTTLPAAIKANLNRETEYGMRVHPECYESSEDSIDLYEFDRVNQMAALAPTHRDLRTDPYDYDKIMREAEAESGFPTQTPSFLLNKEIPMYGQNDDMAVDSQGLSDEDADILSRTYRMRPVEIEAMRWDGSMERALEIRHWADGAVEMAFKDDKVTHMFVDTFEGTMQARPGGWVIKGIHGDFYPCNPDIFEATYEKVIR